VIKKDLENLQKLIEHYEPEKIIIVGDLFHAELNSEIEIFRKWFDRF
jgi:metallophosphoesterase superfamily enzyme